MTSATNSFHLPIPFAYVETTIPSGMTIAEYRASRPPRPGRLARLFGTLAADRREQR